MATGVDFEGCNEIPGEYCSLPKDSGYGCDDNFHYKWFFDMEFGGCSQFVFADCGIEEAGNGNR